jgi:hypothetical protein
LAEPRRSRQVACRAASGPSSKRLGAS